MKNNFNFIISGESVRKTILFLLYLLSAAMTAAVIIMIADSANIRKNMPAGQARLDAIKAGAASQKTPDMPPEKDLAKLYGDIAAINRLSVIKGAAATTVLQKLEKLTPHGISFNSLTYSYGEKNLRIGASARSAGLIPAFMEALEKDRLFSSVSLEKQSQKDTATNGNGVDFTVAMEVESR